MYAQSRVPLLDLETDAESEILLFTAVKPTWLNWRWRSWLIFDYASLGKTCKKRSWQRHDSKKYKTRFRSTKALTGCVISSRGGNGPSFLWDPKLSSARLESWRLLQNFLVDEKKLCLSQQEDQEKCLKTLFQRKTYYLTARGRIPPELLSVV